MITALRFMELFCRCDNCTDLTCHHNYYPLLVMFLMMIYLLIMLRGQEENLNCTFMCVAKMGITAMVADFQLHEYR